MLYHIFYPLHEKMAVLNVFQYITFRAAYAALTALAISFIIGPWTIRKLGEHQIGQNIREEGPESHRAKAGTPTMGGIMILTAIALSTLLWARLDNTYVWMALLTMLGFGAVGFIDDYLKLRHRTNLGLRAKWKLLMQVTIALMLALALLELNTAAFESRITVPFFKRVLIDLGWFYFPFVVFVVVGASNAVNLTDGLDGLAIGPTLVTGAFYTGVAYLAGNARFADYLQIVYVPGAGELTVFCAALIGAGMGFLWYNTYPASVFMGDMGSLALGASLATVAIISKHEVLLVLVGGIFVIETVSVVIQVATYKATGKRVLKMAPLHHHFELLGWPEPKIIVRFWIISIILALVGLSTLKLR
jgi:phospho-N-acetylmuramoyl-pentapeptide-transferase